MTILAPTRGSGFLSTGCGHGASARVIRASDGRLPKVAPSTELRKWYSHQAARFDEFAARYVAELESAEGAAALAELQGILRSGPVTLVTATRDLDGSHVAVLARLLS